MFLVSFYPFIQYGDNVQPMLVQYCQYSTIHSSVAEIDGQNQNLVLRHCQPNIQPQNI